MGSTWELEDAVKVKRLNQTQSHFVFRRTSADLVKAAGCLGGAPRIVIIREVKSVSQDVGAIGKKVFKDGEHVLFQNCINRKPQNNTALRKKLKYSKLD